MDKPSKLGEETSTKEPLWLTYVNDPAVTHDIGTVARSIRSVYECLFQGGPLAIDLSKVSRGPLNLPHAVGLLRATASLRADIPGWIELRDRVKVSLVENGYSEDQILKGL